MAEVYMNIINELRTGKVDLNKLDYLENGFSQCFKELEKRDKVIDKYYKEKNELQCQVKEMQSHIDCLKADLKEAQMHIPDDDLIIHCGNAITVAQDLIDKSTEYTVPILGTKSESYYYSKAELKQIAEHLLVYVNNSEDDR